LIPGAPQAARAWRAPRRGLRRAADAHHQIEECAAVAGLERANLSAGFLHAPQRDRGITLECRPAGLGALPGRFG
jgi:hypothetical protein